jgi:hypothetical protein
MAADKLVDSTQLDADLTSVANAIRTKGGTSAQLAFPADFVSAIVAISGGGAEITEITLAANPSTTVSIPHTLGKVPSFVMIALKNSEKLASGADRYRIAVAFANINVGAIDFNTSTSETADGHPFYMARINNNSYMFNAYDAGNKSIFTADASNVYVAYAAGTRGHLGATTYKVVIG